MGQPVAPPVKSTGRPTEMAGQSVQSSCLMGLAANVMDRAGPGRADTFENLMDPAGLGRENLKLRCAGPGRGPSSEKLMSRAGPRLIR